MSGLEYVKLNWVPPSATILFPSYPKLPRYFIVKRNKPIKGKIKKYRKKTKTEHAKVEPELDNKNRNKRRAHAHDKTDLKNRRWHY